MMFHCKVCGHEWETYPHNLLCGRGCASCSRHLKYTTESFINRINEINCNIEVIGEYINNHTPIKCRCLIDNTIWSPFPSNLLSEEGCPTCNMSHGEKKIMKYLNDNNIDYIPQYSFDDLRGVSGGLLFYDFYLTSYNILIEYQGEFHNHTDRLRSDEEFYKQQMHDDKKFNYAKDHNINLLEIWYYDFDNINNILSEYLSNNTKLFNEE